MSKNLLTAVTNLTAYWPILTALYNADNLTAGVIGFVALASFVSHLFESHKHDMSGFGCPTKWSYRLNRLDILGVILVITRGLYLWWMSGWGLALIIDHPRLFFRAIGVISLNFISELDPGNYYYLPIHCLWHLLVFLLIDEYLKILYV